MPETHSSPADLRTRPFTAILAVIALLVTVLANASSVSASASEEASFVAGVNAARANVGLPALQVDSELKSLSAGWANQMKNGACGDGVHICHANPISAGLTQDWAKLGENVGTGPDVDSVMAAFIASPGHYANIVDPEFTHIGVAVVRDPDNPARLYTTHRFMKLQNAPEPEPEPEPTSEAEAEPVEDSTPAPAVEPEAEPEPTADAPTAESNEEQQAPDEAQPPTPIVSPPPVTLDRAQAVVRALSKLG
jgi:uncharacterized protein YkwD